MQSRGLLPIRRDASSGIINGDVIRGNDPSAPPRTDRGTRGLSEDERHRQSYETRSYERPRRNGHKKRVAYSNNSTYPRDNPMRVAGASYAQRRLDGRREYAELDYNAATDSWRSARDETLDLTWRGGPRVSKPILRNGINHGGDERLYYSTLPRRSRTINFKDQADNCHPGGGRRRAYPKSLQDLTDLELDDVAYFASRDGEDGVREGRDLDDDYHRFNVYQYRREEEEGEEEDDDDNDELLSYDDDYLRLCRSLSRLDKYPRGSRYEPGQVYYERECRTFGKDTVAFIYYKTCYL